MVCVSVCVLIKLGVFRSEQCEVRSFTVRRNRHGSIRKQPWLSFRRMIETVERDRCRGPPSGSSGSSTEVGLSPTRGGDKSVKTRIFLQSVGSTCPEVLLPEEEWPPSIMTLLGLFYLPSSMDHRDPTILLGLGVEISSEVGRPS